ncbi:deoxyribodipyrimidine photo-lyase [Desulfonatronum thioautotrophicum]|uniref:deoxyribodipyrimidine photo-lyase n=1 Tax=Desulfonatronum thioautotrophicum TaxID=617001 RepID=UPI00069A5DBC|nr:deoxyribodipyrimidine photo-lyase [Desulfonatronum thioautotrophicum]
MSTSIHPARATQLNHGAELGKGPVLYWMSRDQRVQDNWALLFAADMAVEHNVPLHVAFCLAPVFLDATIRQYGFLLKGLVEVETELRKREITFHLRLGEPPATLLGLVQELQAGALVTDFDPLRIKRKWKKDVLQELNIPCHEVDAHNIVPCLVASNKQEYAARTIRPKIHRLLDEYLTPFPDLPTVPKASREAGASSRVDWDTAWESLRVNTKVAEVDWLKPGTRPGSKVLQEFLEHRLEHYDQRNDPNAQVLSNLSPYLHFGQISAQRVSLEVMRSAKSAASREAFLEELIVRRELADNFCWYNQAYDTVDGFPDWARKTLDDHRRDKRPYTYDIEEFASATTHDPLWNAAQREMTETGKMHGYMRMYWAKKILEWTSSPEQAMDVAIRLNDTYELDGRDPNGYTGIAWSIGGVHDRPWFERPIFGKIRFMSASGCSRKFSVQDYIDRHCPDSCPSNPNRDQDQ